MLIAAAQRPTYFATFSLRKSPAKPAASAAAVVYRDHPLLCGNAPYVVFWVAMLVPKLPSDNTEVILTLLSKGFVWTQEF
jgi:hypothetical protein